MMKIVGGFVLGIGFLIIAGTAGEMDFNDACRAASDCIAAAPMGILEMAGRLFFGAFGMVVGVAMISNNDDI